MLNQRQTMCCIPIRNVKMTEYNPETDGTNAFKRISIGLDWHVGTGVQKRKCMEHHFVRVVSEVPCSFCIFIYLFLS